MKKIYQWEEWRKRKGCKEKAETRQLQSNTQKNEERKKAVKRMTGVRQNKSINEKNEEREKGAKKNEKIF